MIEVSPWILLAISVPVLLMGEFVVGRVRFFKRFNIPVPVVGGLIISLGVLLLSQLEIVTITFDTTVKAPWWTWLVTPEVEWVNNPEKAVQLPFLVAFFTCVGLNASWKQVKHNSGQVVLFLLLALGLVILQNVVGVLGAKLMGQPLGLGVICGSASMNGGHGTALGFAPVFEKAGLQNAATLGATAATLGLVMGSIVGGPLGGWLIRTRNLKPDLSDDTNFIKHESVSGNFLSTFKDLSRCGANLVIVLIAILVCVKLGSWVSYALKSIGLTFPVYIGAMFLGVVVRNVLEYMGWHSLDSHTIGLFDTVFLSIFLSISMIVLNLRDLSSAALTIVVIVLGQTVLMVFFARFITFRLMGRNYDAAVMSGGHCGFGLGAVPAAMANMEVLVENYGPAPSAFLILPLVGAFLIDVINAFVITLFINCI